MKVFYFIIRILSLPGSAMRCAVEQFVCRAEKIPVESAALFTKGISASHVKHEAPYSAAKAADICVIPFIFGLFFGLAISVTVLPLIFILHETVYYALLPLWFGVSLMLNLFPTRADAKCYCKLARSEGKGLNRAAAAVMRFGAFLEETGLIILTTAADEALILYVEYLIFK